MCFVDASTRWLERSRMLEDIFLGIRRMPEYSIVDWREVQILSNARDPCRYPLYSLARSRNDQRNLSQSYILHIECWRRTAKP